MKTLSRRNVLAGLGALSLPAWFPRMAFAAQPELATAESDILVCLFLRGGADSLNVVVPFASSHYHDARPSLAIAEPGAANGSSAIDLDGYFGLHPGLAPLAELYADGVLAPVHAVGTPDNNRSHFDAMDAMERGTPGEKLETSGWLGRHLATLASESVSPFRAVGMGPIVQASLRGPIAATALQSIADFHLQGSDRVGDLETFQTTLASLYAGEGSLEAAGQQTIDAIAQLAAADPTQYDPENGAVYPTSPFGMAMLEVGRMIKAEVGMEVACVDVGGWDTHEGQGGAEGLMAGNLADLAGGLHAFYTDLEGRMSNITVLVMSEFGRRLNENGAAGTDHGDAGTMLLLGGGVRGGMVYGDWPGLAPEQLSGSGDLAVTTDFRTVLAEVVQKRLLNDQLAEVFPDFDVPPFLGIVEG